MATATRRRLDAELVRKGLVTSPEHARTEIEAGRVTVGGAPATKPTRLVQPGDALRVLDPPPRYVSRAGEKLAAALDRFDLEVRDVRALDAGASTGGFTDCLLDHDAREVVAVDVGHGQLHERLRANSAVIVRERFNVRTELAPGVLGDPFAIVVADLSFISLRLVLAPLLSVCEPRAPLVILVKPQFEASRAEASRGGGIISDPAIWARVLDEVMSAAEASRATIMGAMVSPVTGSSGNVEFLVHLRAPGPSSEPGDHDHASLLARTVAEATDLVAET